MRAMHGQHGILQRRAWAILVIFFASLFFASLPAFSSIDIQLKKGSDREKQTKIQLEKLLHTYDLKKWTVTETIIIEEGAIPHSHPVLTLSTRHLDSDDELLSTYVHEQFHWRLSQEREQTEAAVGELKKLYPKVPVGFPEGAISEESTYEHLIVCYFEMQADRALLGEARTAELMKFWAGDHYRWVYRTILQDEKKIAKIIHRNKLDLP
ncbi:MAG TPA: hypothetical protein VKZ53_28110 [Candidatus Angelobacter sp.]|nr:hypothetical protein [Candidatus Angelobacter sp.]